MTESAPTGQETAVNKGPLWNLIEPVRGRLLAGVVLAALSVPSATLAVIAVAEIGRTLLAGDETATVWLWAGLAVAGAVLRVLLYNASLRLCHRADADFRYLTRARVARHLARVGFGWFDDAGSGTVKRAVNDDVMRMHTVVAHVATDLTTAVLTPLTVVTYLLVVDWLYALVLVAWIGVVVAVTMPRIGRVYRANADEWTRAMTATSRATVELADGIEVVKTYGTSARPAGRFDRAVKTFVETSLRWNAGTGRPTALMAVLFSPATMIVVVLGTGLALMSFDAADPAAILAFLVLGVSLPTSPLHFTTLTHLVREGRLGAGNLQDVLDTPAMAEPEHPRSPANRRVELRDVRFGYTEDREVLHGIDLTLEPGTVTALVGPSGSGKTTLARLIPRFWDVTGGTVLVGGVDVREIATEELLSSMALVFQDVVLLRDTVRENIRIGRPTAGDDDVVEAARRAQIHDAIEALPHGYDTVLGGDTGGLSGGERQRLTIARAIVGKPPIVVLDEATAHADPHSEAAVQRALSELTASSTVLVIAHRLHTVAHADQIVVLDDGRVAERGRHEDLVAASGRYARVWRAQQFPQSSVAGQSSREVTS